MHILQQESCSTEKVVLLVTGAEAVIMLVDAVAFGAELARNVSAGRSNVHSFESCTVRLMKELSQTFLIERLTQAGCSLVVSTLCWCLMIHTVTSKRNPWATF